MKQKLRFLLLCAAMACFQKLNAQSVSFELKTTPDLEFNFNSIEKYIKGIIKPGALELNVTATGNEWDLYIGATTTAAGSFDVINNYSSSGISTVPVGVVQARVYNTSNTPQTGAGFFPISDIASPAYVIGSTSNDAAVDCGDAVPTGTNQPGSYLTDPECYKFKVDLKVAPGLIYRPGLYTLRIDFILVQDL